MRALYAAILGAALLSGSAQAQEECQGIDFIKEKIKEVWPSATFAVYTGVDSDAIERGLLHAGGVVPDAVREFVVIAWPDREKVRIVGIKNGCFEAFIDVDPKTLDTWLAGANS